MADARVVDRSGLLRDLTIDRSERAEEATPRGRWVISLGFVCLIGVGTAILFIGGFARSDDGPASRIPQPPVTDTPDPTPVRKDVGGSVLDATGYVVARRQATVSAQTTGKVASVLIEEGVHVQKGQVIATLDDRIARAELDLMHSRLLSAKSRLAELNVELEHAQLNEQRLSELAQKRLVSQAILDDNQLTLDGLSAKRSSVFAAIAVADRQVDVQRQRLRELQISAPFAGVVVDKAAQPGEMISPISAGGGFTRTGIGTIVDMDSLEVEVDVNEAYINRVATDQPATITLNAYPDTPMPARVLTVVPAADRNKATVRVRIAFLEKDKRVLPNMGVRVAFHAQISIPNEEGSRT